MAAPGNMARRILVVDDDPVVCDSIRRMLATDQHEVEAVTSGQEALDTFQPGKFDLIIMDYEMPAMRGDKLAGTIKGLAPAQRIIMMTGFGESLRLQGSFPLAVDLVIGKPFGLQELLDAVRQVSNKG